MDQSADGSGMAEAARTYPAGGLGAGPNAWAGLRTRRAGRMLRGPQMKGGMGEFGRVHDDVSSCFFVARITS